MKRKIGLLTVILLIIILIGLIKYSFYAEKSANQQSASNEKKPLFGLTP